MNMKSSSGCERNKKQMTKAGSRMLLFTFEYETDIMVSIVGS